MISTVTGLLLTTDPNEGQRVPLLLAEPDRLDLRYLSGVLTLGDGDTDAEIPEVEEYPTVRLVVGTLAHAGPRQLNTVASLLLDALMPRSPDRWWLDLRGGVVLTGLCDCGAPDDLPAHLYDEARRVSDALPRGRNTR